MKTLTTKETAKILNKSEQFIRIGLQQGILPFGSAVNMGTEYSYVIYKKKLEEFIGEIDEERGSA